MARQVIEVGATANDGTGDTLRAAFVKTNEMFGELYSIQFSRLYSDLIGVPTLFSGSFNDLTDVPPLFDGSFNNLTDVPVFFNGDYNSLTNKPALFSGSYNDLTDIPVPFSGSYDDLANKPLIPVIDQDLSTADTPKFAGIEFSDGIQYKAYTGVQFAKYVFTQTADNSVILGQGSLTRWRAYTHANGFGSSADNDPTLTHVTTPDTSGKFSGFYQGGIYEITTVISAVGTGGTSTIAATIKAGDDGATANLGTIGTEFDVTNKATATISTIVRFDNATTNLNQVWITGSDTAVDTGATSYISSVNLTIKKLA